MNDKSILLHLLMVEDSEDDALLLLRELKKGGFAVASERVETADGMQRALQDKKWDLILADYSLPRFNGLAALGLLKKSGLDIPFILVSGTIGEETAVAAMKAGAQDYLLKGRLERLSPAIERELREAALRRERKILEEQFRQSQKMESIGQLTGGIAHDFNNLLGVITGYSELSLQGLKADDPLRENLQEIREASERATKLTRQLLAFSRKQALKPKVVNLNRVMEQMSQMLRRLIGEDVVLITVPSPDLGQVKVDPGQMEQVIMNLVVNARDAMPRGGRLTIETKNVVLDREYAGSHPAIQPGPYVMITVSDTGCGMDAETVEHIFEPFFTTKEKGQGTGLGLSTVYGIVNQSGGHISVDSEPGKGTSFRIHLPRVEG